MKCIKMTDGSIVRVKEGKVAKLIAEGATYASKKEWKNTDAEYKARKEALVLAVESKEKRKASKEAASIAV